MLNLTILFASVEKSHSADGNFIELAQSMPVKKFSLKLSKFTLLTFLIHSQAEKFLILSCLGGKAHCNANSVAL